MPRLEDVLKFKDNILNDVGNQKELSIARGNPVPAVENSENAKEYKLKNIEVFENVVPSREVNNSENVQSDSEQNNQNNNDSTNNTPDSSNDLDNSASDDSNDSNNLSTDSNDLDEDLLDDSESLDDLDEDLLDDSEDLLDDSEDLLDDSEDLLDDSESLDDLDEDLLDDSESLDDLDEDLLDDSEDLLDDSEDLLDDSEDLLDDSEDLLDDSESLDDSDDLDDDLGSLDDLDDDLGSLDDLDDDLGSLDDLDDDLGSLDDLDDDLGSLDDLNDDSESFDDLDDDSESFDDLNDDSESFDDLDDDDDSEGLDDLDDDSDDSFMFENPFADKDSDTAGTSLTDKLNLTEKQFQKFIENLNTFPLRLKLEIEKNIINDNADESFIGSLIRSVSDGSSPQSVSKNIKRNTGVLIDVPKGYKKLTSSEYEEILSSFPTRFRKELWPVLRLITLISMAFLGLSLLGFKFIFKPIYADYLYKKGIEYIADNKYLNSEEEFTYAYGFYPDNSQFEKYANAYLKKNKFKKAYNKYIELLGKLGADEPIGKYELAYDPEDKQGIISFATFLSNNYMLDNYENYDLAQSYLKRILRKNREDYDALIASANVFLSHGDSIRIPESNKEFTYDKAKEKRFNEQIAQKIREKNNQYENLRKTLSTINPMDADNRARQLGLRYYIRKDEYTKLKYLENELLSTVKPDEIDSVTFLELIEYLISKNKVEDLTNIFSLLNKLEEAKGESLQLYFYKSKYFKLIEDYKKERAYLTKTISLLENEKKLKSLNEKELKMEIESIYRLGELDMKASRFQNAKSEFLRAIKLYETELEFNRIERNIIFWKNT